MNEWIKGPPTELGMYWAMLDASEPPLPIEVNDRWGKPMVAFLGDDLFVDLDTVEWHMPLTLPSPPEKSA